MARLGTSDADLQRSIDRLTDAFDRLATRLEGVEPGPVSSGEPDRLMHHIRRYMPFYALATVWLLMIVLLPTTGPDDEVTSVAGGPNPQVTSGALTTPGAPSTRTPTTASEAAASDAGSTPVDGEAGAPTDAPDAQAAAGVTRAGYECADGVRQIPWSAYAAPCVPASDGSNPGETYRGVDAEKILIVDREFPDSANSQAVDAFAEAAGAPPDDVVEAIRDEFIAYFNEVFELWGRQVEHVTYVSEFGDSTAEAQSRGKEGACADADVIANDLGAFAVVSGSNVFAECAADRGLMVFEAGAYFPESWYRQYHPFLWNGITGCERISYQVAEYIGKRLANKPATWAKGLEKDLPRVFGTMVPNNDAYQDCTDITEETLKRDFGLDPGSRYNYTLDVSRFPDEAAQAILRFKADGVTSIVLACDPITPMFMTQTATSQNYFPEWVLIGVALTDVDNVPRLWDQQQIRGSLFGMSQLGATEMLLGPESESARTYKEITGTDIPDGTTGEYHGYLRMFSWLQAAGPTLTPETVAQGIWSLPPGGPPRYEIGYVSYLDGPDGTPGAGDHTGIDDSREVYWMADTVSSSDGDVGTYHQTYDGQRFRNGEWPAEDPPIYPDQGSARP